MSSPVIASSVRAIALVEWAKGAVALSLATGLITAGPQRLQVVLLRLVDHLHIGHGHGPFAWLNQGFEAGTLDVIAALCGVYALLRAIEGWGLWHQRRWATWLGVGSAAAYLPFDLYALHRDPGVFSVVMLLLNLGLIGLLSYSLTRHRRANAAGST